MRPSETVLELMYDGVSRPSRASNRWESTALEGHRTGYVAFQNTLSVMFGEQTTTMAKAVFFALLIVVASSVSAEESESRNDEFVSIFDGESLDGWHAVPKESASDWTVRDRAIVGRGSADRLAYLVWKDEHLTDFELELRYRLPGNGNTGVEIRCQHDVTGKRPFEGYHADLGHVGIGPQILGAWDFHFAKRKEYPCPRGTRLVIDEDGKPQSSTIREALTAEDVRPHAWNHVRVVARGNHFQFFINGKLASEFTDNAQHGRLDQGAIGLQIHDKGMQVEFKDLRLKRLASVLRPEQRPVSPGRSS